MLQAIRSKAASWVVKGLFLLLILSFAVWGIGDIFRGPGVDTTVVTVGDAKISMAEVQTRFRRELNRLQNMFGGAIDAEKARAFGVLDEVIEQIATGTALDLGALRLGLTVGDEQVRQAIRDEPAFRDQTGQFSATMFGQALRANSMTEQSYVDSIKRDITRAQILGAATGGARAPEGLVDLVYRQREERRVVEMARFDNAAMPAPPAPDDAQLEAFHKQNAGRFSSPEYRTVTYVSLTPDDLLDTVTVTPEKVKETYDHRLDEFTKPERRTLEQILLTDKAKIDDVSARIKGGMSFADAAKDVAGLDPTKLSVGSVAKAELVPALAEPVFALAKEGITDPIESPFGWHILHVTAIEPGGVEPLEAVSERLKTEVARELAADRLFDVANKVEDELAAGGSLEDAAKRFALKLAKLDAIDRQGRDRQGKAAEGMAATPAFLEAAFGLQQGEQTTLRETRDGGYFVARVDQVIASALRPLADVRAEVVEAWIAAERDAAAKKQADALSAKLKEGGEFAATAEAAGATLSTSKPFTRQANDPASGAPPAVAAAAFRLQKGGLDQAATGDGHVVFRLAEVIAADPGANAAEVDKLRQQLRQGIGGDLAAGLNAALKQRFPVHVEQKLIERLF
jgi:peptidyl-prolyl cis-trans isomerase D